MVPFNTDKENKMIYVYTLNSIGLNNIVFFSSTNSAYNYAVNHDIRMANGKIKVVRCKSYTANAVRGDVRLRRKAIEKAKRNTSTEMTENV